ncbi:large conductance mechanosensitive channel protein MscL [Hymenobacter sp. GOD-10R]|uniref:large conductance mechanosensitive channel protein MscL n=1 Tax=Hymenobacter sp. GOD-10R TaxID=3093922 RepID=UPI002D76C6B1|nr:large conductance mechanosensitive channel protein MscL [Hymenobacter sp. GOD-10R]WRQ31587.1 large conductance mechanosensitive channel protein MscL [Hymenobacter sp. GOD-10R]
MSFIAEFKEFVSKGNVLDLAVGVIIGAAFSKIVDSMVNDILMPVVGLANHGKDFKDAFLTLNSESYGTLEQAKAAGAATLNYGLFLNAVLNFLIIAFVIFWVVKLANYFRRPAPTLPVPVLQLTKDQMLLMEIRDSLRPETRLIAH